MIDAHIHAITPRLPGGKSHPPIVSASLDEIAAALSAEMWQAGIETAFAMGSTETTDTDPLGLRDTLRIAERVDGLYTIGFADPRGIGPERLQGVEEAVRAGTVKALKGYLGYFHYGPSHENYEPFYAIAARYGIPFFFHTGDTHSTTAKLKYAHPLLVDEVAVDHPDVTFVMAHLGNPWLTDAAEVIYKNKNVWADLSGFIVGDEAEFARLRAIGARDEMVRDIRKAIEYSESYDKILYGTDWPLVSMRLYREFIEEIIPADLHAAVFSENARRLFRLDAD